MRTEEISSDDGSLQEPKLPLSPPEKQMYDIELSFFSLLKDHMDSIKNDTHKLLTSLTDAESRNRKKIPYTTFRSFETVVKRGRKLKEFIKQQNKKYQYIIESREEVKKQNNCLFRFYLKNLHEKKQELKYTINALEKKIQELEDSGSLPYVDFYCKLPQNMDLRITYNTKILLSRVQLRSQVCNNIYNQFTEYKTLKCQPLHPNDDSFKNQLDIVLSKELFYYRQLRDGLVALRLKKKKQQVCMQRLKGGVRKLGQQIEKWKKQEQMKDAKSKMTQTDHFIYLKQLYRELQKRMQSLPLDEYPKARGRNISKSSPK